MRDDGVPQPVLVVFPSEDEEPKVMLDPLFLQGLDEVGLFLSDIAKHYARTFVQSGRARDLRDALDQIQEIFNADITEPFGEEEVEEAQGSVDED
ncbi:MAG: DUF5076 domain-containing protein [Pseudomonadota bacterium]